MSADPITCTERTHYFQPSVNGIQPPRCYCGKRDAGEMRGVVALVEGTLTVPADSTASLLVRAADRLDELDKAATQGAWVSDIDEMACPRIFSPKRPFGVVAEVDTEQDRDLIVATRPSIGPTARLLRAIARRAAELSPASDGYLGANILGYREAVALAREILGEHVTVTATVPYVAPHGGRIEAGETFEVREVAP